MSAALIIDSKNAASAGVRARDRIVFWLSWVLWAALLMHLLSTAYAKRAALAGAIGDLYRYWMLSAEQPEYFHVPARYAVSLAVVAGILAWSLLKRAHARWKPRHEETTALELLAMSTYFDINPHRLLGLRAARRVVIRHTGDGVIAEIKSSALDSPPSRPDAQCAA